LIMQKRTTICSVLPALSEVLNEVLLHKYNQSKTVEA
jgi:hypothetical protein